MQLNEVLETLVMFGPYLLIAFGAVSSVILLNSLFKHPTLSHSIDETVKKYLESVSKGRLTTAWNHLSENLKTTLENTNRRTINDAQVKGIDYLSRFLKSHEQILKNMKPRVQAKRRVNTRGEEEMIMVQVACQKSKSRIVFWVTRTPSISGYWLVEEILIYLKPGKRAYVTLTGKRIGTATRPTKPVQSTQTSIEPQDQRSNEEQAQGQSEGQQQVKVEGQGQVHSQAA